MYYHLLYADDICLMSSTATDMQCMMDICYIYGLDKDVLFNSLQSVCMLFKPKGYTFYRSNLMIGTEVSSMLTTPSTWELHFVKQRGDHI